MTPDGRGAILERIRSALASARLPDSSAIHPAPFTGYTAAPAAGAPQLIERFGEELAAQQGVMHRAANEADAASIALALLERHGRGPVLSWDDRWLDCPELVPALTAAGIEMVRSASSTEPVRHGGMDAIEPIAVGLTGAFAGLADTGSLVLISGSGRSRVASLLPPIHIAILRQSRVFATLPAFLAANRGAIDLGSNAVLVTGPSRTADIEMSLTHGVHGPREVHVIVVP